MIRRIKIKGFSDIKKWMKELGIDSVAEFFILYESKNQEMPRPEVWNRMSAILETMRNSISEGSKGINKTSSGMVDGLSAKMRAFSAENGSLIGGKFSEITASILAVSEANACMKKIAAAPTAGSSGVLPGTLLPIAAAHSITDDKLIEALFVSGGIGEIISANASLSGAIHGCQAEIGSASAMAAAGLTYMFNGDLNSIESAAAFALKNMLGLVCDPVAGLVEIPCIKRNVMGGMNAIACAEMALAGIRTVIPLDEVIKAMNAIGRVIPHELRETSEGGLAVTPTAIAITERLKSRQSN
jgi:L-serine dehydratase